ncbi:NAD(P)/FAD-dependent oxidoreductase [Paracidobacterium acidisoli]|uniref:NAD(P)/FAD-dependent oxidoreductase n=1 Tax=Paracidobacterium acidisoli TaxID=2303751 RepID=UPI00331617F7
MIQRNETATRADVVIAGAGIIGLATALALADAGLHVVVFERGTAMSESSWAAAGMLAGCDPENPAALRELSLLSLALYPEFLARIEELSGETIPLRTRQTLQGTDHLPFDLRALKAAEAEALAPGLRTGGQSFTLLDEHSLDPRDLGQALPAAARAAGVELHEGVAVNAVHSGGDGVVVETTAGPLTARHFVNAAGAWAGSPGTSAGASLPVAPRKGQMLAVELPGEVQLRCVLRTPELYIVPRGGGRYVIGATVEDLGFDKQVFPAQIDALLASAATLWTPLRGARIVETWAGLRPGTADGLPVIDRVAPGILVAAGHFRNGILLAPATARAVRELIGGRRPAVELSAFRANRFDGMKDAETGQA